MGFPDGSVVKNPPAVWETWVRSLGWKEPLEKGIATHFSILAWRIPWTEKPAGYSHGVAELDTTERLSLKHFLALPFFGIGMKTDLFQSCGHC